MPVTPVYKRQFGSDAVNSPLTFTQLDSNFAYFENMATGDPGYLPVLSGQEITKTVTSFTITYQSGSAQLRSAIRQFGGNGILASGIPVLEASSSFNVFGQGHFTGSLSTSGGLFATSVSASAMTASVLQINQIFAGLVTGTFTGSLQGFLTGSMSGTFFGTSSGRFEGFTEGTSSATAAGIQQILINNNGATSSLFLQGGTLRVGEGNLVVLGTSSLGGYLTTENTKLGNNNTDVHFVSGGWTICAPYVNGTYPAGFNVTNGTNVAIGDGTTSIRGITTLSSSLYVGTNQWVTGTLQVTGAVGFASTLDVKNNTSITGSITSTVNSYVGANSFVTGTLQVTGAVGFASTLDVKNNTTITGSLTNTGNTVLGGTLTVPNNAVLSSSVWIGTNLVVTGSTQITGSLGVGSTLDVKNNTTVTGSITNTGNTVLGGTLSVSSNAIVSSSLWVGTNATITGSMQVTGSAGFASTVDIKNNLTVTGSVTNTGATVHGGTLSVSGISSFSSSVNVNGTLQARSNSEVTGTLGVTGNTNLAGNTALGGTLSVAGTTTLNGRLDTTTNTALGGTLSVLTGASFSGSLNVNGTLQARSNAQVTGTLGVTGATSIAGATALGSTLSVPGTTTLNGNLVSNATSSFNGPVTFTGPVTMSSGLAGVLTVDDSSVEYTTAGTAYNGSTNKIIRVKALGITNAMLAGSIANAKLSNNTISGVALGGNLLNLTVDDSSIEYSTAGATYNGSAAKTIRVKALGITNAMLAGSIANAKLSNSTISGIALGGDLTALTAGSYLTSGGTYNGSTARTFAVDATTAGTASKIVARDANGYVNAAAFFQTSKRDSKRNIIPFEKDALDIIRRTKVVEFEYKIQEDDQKHIGFIADDTPEELATKNHDQMDTNSAIGVLLKAVQQLEEKIKELEAKLESK